MKLVGGTNHPVDENLPGLIDDRALQILFRAEVSEQSALADPQKRGEFPDCETLEALDRRDIDGSP
jgi:hypothetical protein